MIKLYALFALFKKKDDVNVMLNGRNLQHFVELILCFFCDISVYRDYYPAKRVDGLSHGIVLSIMRVFEGSCP